MRESVTLRYEHVQRLPHGFLALAQEYALGRRVEDHHALLLVDRDERIRDRIYDAIETPVVVAQGFLHARGFVQIAHQEEKPPSPALFTGQGCEREMYPAPLAARVYQPAFGRCLLGL